VRISYSKVNSYKFCPKKYEYRYVKMIPVPEKPELAFGIALHAALEVNFKQKIASFKDVPDKEVIAAFNDSFNERARGISKDVMPDDARKEFLKMAEYFIRRFMYERAPEIQSILKGVECFFRLPLEGDIELTGKFDLVDKKGILHDFKTSSKPYDPKRADFAQLVIYAWACERLFGKCPYGLCFDVFVKGAENRPPDFQVVNFETPVKDRFDGVIEEIKKTIKFIIAKKFPRAFNPERCDWCEYQEICLKDYKSGAD